MGNTLIFPSSVPAARAYAFAARQRGEPIIAASSLAYDDTAKQFEHWVFLPGVYDADFPQRLNDVIAAHDCFWLHGDGPRQVGDALLQTRAGDIRRSFVCGRALFVQFGGAHAG